MLSITGEKRIDQWLGERLQAAGAPELALTGAIEVIRAESTRMFQGFPAPRPRHTFVVSGWVGHPPVARTWLIDNGLPGSDFSARAPATAFSVVEVKADALMTGAWACVTRAQKKLMKVELRQAQSLERVEEVLVQTIRRAAGKSDDSVIGRNCSAVSLSPNGACRATYYREGANGQSFGPLFLWYEGGRNLLVGDAEVLPGGRYALAFGNGCKFVQQVESSNPTAMGAEPSEILAAISVRLGDAKHHPDEEIREISIVRVVDRHHEQSKH